MDLHRSDKIPDWEKIPPEEHNIFQKVAAKTNGMVTLGNAISLHGLYMRMKGSYDIWNGQTLAGTIELGVGSVDDIADGMGADLTGTKSPTGEGVDAVIDKITLFVTGLVLVKKSIVSKRLAFTAGLQNGANMTLTAIAKKRDVEIHPSKEGKWATGLLWGVIGYKGLAQAAREYEKPVLAKGLDVVGHVSTAIYAVLGAKATAGYLEDAFAKKRNN